MDLNKSVVAYKSVRKDFEAFLRVGEALEEISSLQNYKVEAEVAAKKAKKDLSDVNGLLLVRRSELREEVEKVEFAKKEAHRVVDNSEGLAKETIINANDNAARIVYDAREWASSTKQAAIDDVENERDELLKLEAEKEKVSKQIDNLNSEFIKLKRRFG